jgi:AP-1-like factor
MIEDRRMTSMQRRRAQNRASQRAFRDRKEKHMRELEQRLGELEGRHSDLSRSYESLQLEYSSAKTEVERLRKENARLEGSASSSSSTAREVQSSSHSHVEGGEESKPVVLDPLLFDVSAFCFGEDHDRKE